jgi:hypothetical protein
MTIYDPIFGIYFLPPILSVVERIHITKSKQPDSARHSTINIIANRLMAVMGI